MMPKQRERHEDRVEANNASDVDDCEDEADERPPETCGPEEHGELVDVVAEHRRRGIGSGPRAAERADPPPKARRRNRTTSACQARHEPDNGPRAAERTDPPPKARRRLRTLRGLLLETRRTRKP